MSAKRALLFFGCAVLVGTLGGAMTLGTAAGNPSVAAGVVHQAARQAGPVPAHPRTTLQIPTTIHLIDRNTGSVRPTPTSVVTNASLTKKGRPAGGAVYTCTVSSGRITSCDSAFGLSRGMFLAHLTHRSDGSFKGPIRQGTGKYAGASGTVRLVPTTAGKGKLTISYATG